MRRSKIVTIGPVFTLCNVFLAVAVVIAKAPYLGALASVKGTATTTPEIKNLIGPASENKRAARAARTYEQVRAILYKTTT